jgi:hypothetical protein
MYVDVTLGRNSYFVEVFVKLCEMSFYTVRSLYEEIGINHILKTNILTKISQLNIYSIP